jgi:hypothetical protein
VLAYPRLKTTGLVARTEDTYLLDQRMGQTSYTQMLMNNERTVVANMLHHENETDGVSGYRKMSLLQTDSHMGHLSADSGHVGEDM